MKKWKYEIGDESVFAGTDDATVVSVVKGSKDKIYHHKAGILSVCNLKSRGHVIVGHRFLIDEEQDLKDCIGSTEAMASEKSKYHREIKPGVFVDVYDVLAAWNVTNPALQHLIKKALQPGARGHKTTEQDMQDIIDSAIRAKLLGA